MTICIDLINTIITKEDFYDDIQNIRKDQKNYILIDNEEEAKNCC